MSTVVVTESHTLAPEEAKARLADFEQEIGSKYGMKVHWNGLSADLKGTGANGDVKVTSSEVTITVKIGMLARAFVKPDLLETSIRKRLKAAMND